jgi:hypothetical protein
MNEKIRRPSKKNKKDFNTACIGLTHLKNNNINTKSWNFFDLYFHGLLVKNKIRIMKKSL